MNASLLSSALPLASITTLEVLGYTAATLTTCSFIPQAIKTIKTRNTTGISVGMYATFTAGVVLWMVYGMIIGSWPVIVANAITAPLAAIILILKIKHG